MNTKNFKIPAANIKPLATGLGSCYASDMILVDGRQVGFFYREAPENETDSGWRFMSGEESDDYINDPKNLAIYDVNTVANYDPDIIPYLKSPVGSEFARDRNTRVIIDVTRR